MSGYFTVIDGIHRNHGEGPSGITSSLAAANLWTRGMATEGRSQHDVAWGENDEVITETKKGDFVKSSS